MPVSVDGDDDSPVRRQESEESSSNVAVTSQRCSRWRRAAQIMFGEARLESRSSYFVFDPDSIVLFYWMGAMALATVYNAWMSALRIAFPEARQEPIPVYLRYLDVTCDFIYAADIIVQLRTAFLQDGIPVFDPTKIRNYYLHQTYFMQDIISAVPAENLFFLISDMFGQPEYLCMLSAARLTKLFKFHVLYRFYDLAESRTSIPHFVRVFRLSLALAVVIHWIACFYYLVSEYEGLGSNNWVYTHDPNQQNFRRKYIICMYWSAMTLTTIGSTNSPETDLEYIFTGVIFLTGVFIFAMVLGNVGDIISSMNANRQEFQARMDHIKMYLTHKKVPPSLQLKIKKWAEYSWSRTKATDESRLLNILPERLRAEVAVHVHLDNLKKIKIFEQCEQGFLCELVLKLKSQVFSPGDYICKVGETGREMFIINHGKVEVLVPNPATNKDMVVAVLCEGNYFGEISLLRLDGVQNRRTADVRSIGYSELLCLSRRDLMTALLEYPEAKSVLESQAKKRMKTSLQAQRAFSVDTLLRSSQEHTSFDGTVPFKEESRGRDVSEIKEMIEELKRINKVPGKTIWQLIARCELLQDKIREKEREADDSKHRIQELECMLADFSSTAVSNTRNKKQKPQRVGQKITKQFSHDEGRCSFRPRDLNSQSSNNSKQTVVTEVDPDITPTNLLTRVVPGNLHQMVYNGKNIDSVSQSPGECVNVQYRTFQKCSTVQNSSQFEKILYQSNTDFDNSNSVDDVCQTLEGMEDYSRSAYYKVDGSKTGEHFTSTICEITEEEENEEIELESGSVQSYAEGGTLENVSRYLKRNYQVFNEEDLQLEKTLYDSVRQKSKSNSDSGDNDLLNPGLVSVVTHLCEPLNKVDDMVQETVSKDNNLLGRCIEIYSNESGSRKSSDFSGSEREPDSNSSSDE